MAIVTRYFSTSGAGAADGTSWANRAALFSAGNWSTVITGFDFSGSDSLGVRIEGGLTYTCSQAMASGLFSNAPSLANLIFFHGCDSSGNLLEPPDSNWVSCQAPFSTSTLPVIATSSNIYTNSLANSSWRCIGFTASGRTGAVVSVAAYNWCAIINSTSSTIARGCDNPSIVQNSYVTMPGASFDYAITATASQLSNVRVDGTAATTSGIRIGVTTTSSGYYAIRVTVVGCAGGGMFAATGSATRSSFFYNCTVVNCGAYGIQCNGTASQTVWHLIAGCYVANCGTYGIDSNGSRTLLYNTRLRDNTSGNLTGFGNYPTDRSVYTTDSDDATEFVDSGSGDYRIKNTASNVWGKGFGAGDEAAAGGGGMIGGGNLSGGFQ